MTYPLPSSEPPQDPAPQPNQLDSGGYGGYGGQGDGTSNGDGGDNELVTKTDLAQHAQGINDRLDSIQGGLQNAGGVQDRNNAFQGGGSQQAAAPRPDVLGAIAEHNANIYSQMADSHAAMQNRMDRFQAHFRQRQAQGGMHATQPTGNGMGQTSQESSMAGLLGRQVGGGISSNGQSESTFANTRFGGQQ